MKHREISWGAGDSHLLEGLLHRLRPVYGSRASCDAPNRRHPRRQHSFTAVSTWCNNSAAPLLRTLVQAYACSQYWRHEKSGNCCCRSRRYEHRCPCEARTAQAVLKICWRYFSCDTRTPARYEYYKNNSSSTYGTAVVLLWCTTILGTCCTSRRYL